MSRYPLIWLTPVAILLGFLALHYWAVPIQPKLTELHEGIARLHGWIRAQPLLYGAGFLAAAVALSALPFPLFMLAFAGGAVFDFWPAVLLVSIGSTIGGTLSMLASRHILAGRLQRMSVIRRLNSSITHGGALAFLSLRLMPGIPFCGLSLAAGLTTLSLHSFVVNTMIGKLPLIMIFAGAGAQLAEIDSASDVISGQMIGLLILLAVFPLLAMWISQRIKKGQAG